MHPDRPEATGRHVTVAVAAPRTPELLAACLDSLDRARERSPASVVVARPGDGDDVRPVLEGRHDVTLVPAGDRHDVPTLRGLALEHAPRARWYAVTEDHCLAEPRWLERLVGGVDDGVSVVGGGMGNARPRAIDWGAFFAEYGFFGSGRPAPGPSDAASTPPLVTGANVAYSAQVVDAVTSWCLEGLWENTIHARLFAEGASFRWVPEARVLQNASYTVAAFCRDRFEHGFDYARTRLAEEPRSRWLLAAASPLLPPLLTARVGRAAQGEDLGAFIRALPFTVLFLTAWSVGEAAGYLRGAR